ncbi:MAG TPA: hypothetical protein V6C63_20655 [Allocoleopsis sp.]
MVAQKLIGHQYSFMENLGLIRRRQSRSRELTALIGWASQWEIDNEGTSAQQ